MADIPEMKAIPKGLYLAKCVEDNSIFEFTIHRGIAGYEGQKLFMRVGSQFALDDIRSQLHNDGWCIIKVLHKRRARLQTELMPYVNQVHPLEK